MDITTSQIAWTLGLGTAAGLAGTLGGVMARTVSTSEAVKNFIAAFGAGALMGAVGLILLPHAVENLALWMAVGMFCIGGLLAMALDRATHRKMRHSGSSTLSAMFLDFVPEAIVVGALVPVDLKQAIIVTVIIAAQNLPEGFAAYLEGAESDSIKSGKKMLLLLMGLPLVGLMAAAFGFWLCGLHDVMLSVIMAGASGGILYLVLRRIIPDSETEGCGPWPAYGGVIGFSVALIGFGLTAH